MSCAKLVARLLFQEQFYAGRSRQRLPFKTRNQPKTMAFAKAKFVSRNREVNVRETLICH